MGPFLFVVFINDLAENFSSTSKLYAGDTKLLSEVTNYESHTSVQNDLDLAVEWSKKWLFDFNFAKCVVTHFGNNNSGFKYSMNQIELNETTMERDLGVIFTADLKWKHQVIVVPSKANSILGMIIGTLLFILIKG